MIETRKLAIIRGVARTWVLLVLGHGVLYAQPVAPRARIVEDLRLDATEYDFPTVGRIHVGLQQQIIVPIQADGQLRIFDSLGKHLRTVGRKGSGPGEFTFIGLIGWNADTLWIDDGTQLRLTYFGPNFKLLRTRTYPSSLDPPLKLRVPGQTATHSIFGVSGVFNYADGSRVVRANVPPNGSAAQRAWGGDNLLAYIDAKGAPRVIAKLPWIGDPRWAMSVEGFGNQIPFTYWESPVASSTGDRIAFMFCEFTSNAGGTFTVTVMRPTGETLFVRTFPFKGDPIAKFSRDSAIATFLPRPGRRTEGPADMPQRFQELAKRLIPPVHAGVEFVNLGLDNTVWVGLHRTSAGQPILALNSKGDPLATILVPRNSRFRQANAQHVWMTEADDDGLVSVVRYRISGISCGAQRC